MADFEIGQFVTKELANAGDFAQNDKLYAARVARDYIEGAFTHSNYTCDVKIETEKFPDPPSEAPGKYVCEKYGICGKDADGKCYNTVWNWFVDWWKYKDCKDEHLDVEDCYHLLTNHDGGGRGTGRTAVSGVSRLPNLDRGYNHFGYDKVHNQIDTVLEDCGHCFIENMSDEDGDGSGHDSGMIKEDRETNQYGISPMGIKDTEDPNYNTQRNNCGNYYDKDKKDGWVFEYSPCSEEHFVP